MSSITSIRSDFNSLELLLILAKFIKLPGVGPYSLLNLRLVSKKWNEVILKETPRSFWWVWYKNNTERRTILQQNTFNKLIETRKWGKFSPSEIVVFLTTPRNERNRTLRINFFPIVKFFESIHNKSIKGLVQSEKKWMRVLLRSFAGETLTEEEQLLIKSLPTTVVLDVSPLRLSTRENSDQRRRQKMLSAR